MLSCKENKTTEPEIKQTVVAPVFHPEGATYTEPIEVSIGCSTENAVIRYTLNGDDPTEESDKYSTRIEITATSTLKAQAYLEGWNDSQITSADYIITGRVATPIIEPTGGVFTQPQEVKLSCATEGSIIRYSFGEYHPTEDSPLYSAPITVSQTVTLHASAYKEGWAQSEVASANFTIYSVKSPLMQFIGQGTFTMGNTKEQNKPSELPTHQVTLSDYRIGKYPIKQSEWVSVMGEWSFEFADNPDHPADNISWYAALVYCNKLSIGEGITPVYSINGSTNPDDWGNIPNSANATWDSVVCDWSSKGYRLPTESEWEFAARSRGNDTDFLYSGSNNIDLVAWYNGISPLATRPVGLKRPNILQIYDMSGNIREWCWDRYGNYTPTPKHNPHGPGSGEYSVNRGGSYNDDADTCRISARGFDHRYKSESFYGLRVVKAN